MRWDRGWMFLNAPCVTDHCQPRTGTAPDAAVNSRPYPGEIHVSWLPVAGVATGRFLRGWLQPLAECLDRASAYGCSAASKVRPLLRYRGARNADPPRSGTRRGATTTIVGEPPAAPAMGTEPFSRALDRSGLYGLPIKSKC